MISCLWYGVMNSSHFEGIEQLRGFKSFELVSMNGSVFNIVKATIGISNFILFCLNVTSEICPWWLLGELAWRV